MSVHPWPRPPTPLERMCDDALAAWRLTCWYQNAAFQRKAMSEIHAMAVVHHRGLGQMVRQAHARISNFMKEQR